MHLDVLNLRSFYYRSALGRAAQKALRDQIVTIWPESKGQTVVGFGFAIPLLRPFMADARRIIGLMPGQQGAMPWPPSSKNLTALCEETMWPLATGSVDKLILLHGLETSERQSELLEECWRVLGPGGRAMFIVPNRGGLWARRDKTPFGFGRPYSMSQLESQLKEFGFVPENHAAALYAPPSHRKFWLRTGPFWENLGGRVSGHLAGGVLLIEASKQVFAPTKPGLPERVRRPLRVLEGMVQPDAKPV